MSVFRKNVITNDWVIFAPNRAKRPRDLKADEHDNVSILAARPAHKPDCPFCPGNEKPEDRELLRLDGENGWRVRILENLFSSVDRTVLPTKRTSHLRNEIEGFGIHDVVIDNPKHNMILALMSTIEITYLLTAYRMRYQQIQRNNLVRHIVVFKNQGIRAGGSLEHSHSQLYGLPVIPFEANIRLREGERYHDLNGSCLMCDILKKEDDEQVRVVFENAMFICLMPYADLSPYHFWIVPKSHSPSFALITDGEIAAMAECMKVVFAKMFNLLRNPDFNYVIQSLAHHERENEYFHWYLSVIPQVKHKGGLEYAGGLFVNTVLPEVAAAEMRDASADIVLPEL
ncbi:MAG: galactose-1-phosphate uridylyltransferase [Spirochaetes bacterium]|nr:galactose-1-phosphate uridylyltransferase [Spirochaetota bacterium]